jgi:hypothetical protein
MRLRERWVVVVGPHHEELVRDAEIEGERFVTKAPKRSLRRVWDRGQIDLYNAPPETHERFMTALSTRNGGGGGSTKRLVCHAQPNRERVRGSLPRTFKVFWADQSLTAARRELRAFMVGTDHTSEAYDFLVEVERLGAVPSYDDARRLYAKYIAQAVNVQLNLMAEERNAVRARLELAASHPGVTLAGVFDDTARAVRTDIGAAFGPYDRFLEERKRQAAAEATS